MKLRDFLLGRYSATELDADVLLVLPEPVSVDCVRSDPVWANDGPTVTHSDGSVWQPQIGTFTVVTPAQGDGLPCDLTPITREVLVSEAPTDFAPEKIGDSAVRTTPGNAPQVITGEPNLPSLFYLHGTGQTTPGAYGDLWAFVTPDVLVNYPHADMQTSFTVEQRPDKLIIIRPLDHIRHPDDPTRWVPLFWLGVAEKVNNQYVMKRFVERRNRKILDFCIQHYNLDPNRISVAGASLGGIASVYYGADWYDKFCVSRPAMPHFQWHRAPALDSTGIYKSSNTPILEEDGSDFWANIDMLARLRDPSVPSVPYLVSIGQQDADMPWTTQLQAIDALKEGNRWFVFAWNNGNHGGSGPVSHYLDAQYNPYFTFSRIKSLPRFSNSSIDDDPTVIIPLSASYNDIRGINLGFKWRNVVDEADRWACEISNTRATADMTVDVAPHNCQAYTGSVTPKPVAIPLGQWVAVEFLKVTEPEEPQEPEGPIEIHHKELDLTSLVMFESYHASSRYERFQHLQVLTGDAPVVKFHKIDLAAGGAIKNLSATSYELVVDGQVREVSSSVVGSKGEFIVDTTQLADGWHLFDINVPSGECSVPWHMYVNRSGGQVQPSSHIPVVAGSYDITHGGKYSWAMVPAALNPKPMPLEPRETPHFSDAASYTTLYARSLVPTRGETNLNRPNTTASGIVNTFNKQAYFWDDLIRKYPMIPLLDGPRGVGNLFMPTHLQPDHAGGCWFLDPWRFGKVWADGRVQTMLGFRSRPLPRNYEDGTELDVVGDWQCEPGLHEAWGFGFDERTLTVNTAAPQIGGEHPHVTGPVLFVADSQNDRILKAVFSPVDREIPPVVTEFLSAQDPWDCRCLNGVLYVSERKSHRIAAYDIDTGALIRVVVEGLPLAAISQNRVAVATAPLADLQAQPCVAPEGIEIQDGWLYYASYAAREVKRVNLDTGEIQLVCPVIVDDNSKFAKITLSDGTFGPRGTCFVSTWSIASFGRPKAYLPGGAAWNYQSYNYASGGKGGMWASLGYASAAACGRGKLFCGSSQEGLQVISKALPGDVVPDHGKYFNGRNKWIERGYRLVYGDHGFGFRGDALPFGEDADIDYYLTFHGHAE